MSNYCFLTSLDFYGRLGLQKRKMKIAMSIFHNNIAMNMSYGVVYARLLTRGNSFRVHCFCLRFVDDRHLVLRLSKYS